jgi:thiol-disulfide isomerase/thioredoxin
MKVLKFGAVWCKECLVMRPLWAEIESEIPWLETEYVDVDEQPDRADAYRIETAPVAVFVDGQGGELARLSGMKDKEEILKSIEKYRNI